LPLMPTGKISNFFLRILVITFNNDLLWNIKEEDARNVKFDF
jgi:hypothetical protein